MQLPANAGSFLYNYKHTHSIVLKAVAGTDYECIYADVVPIGELLMLVFGTSAACPNRLMMAPSQFLQLSAYHSGLQGFHMYLSLMMLLHGNRM